MHLAENLQECRTEDLICKQKKSWGSSDLECFVFFSINFKTTTSSLTFDCSILGSPQSNPMFNDTNHPFVLLCITNHLSDLIPGLSPTSACLYRHNHCSYSTRYPNQHNLLPSIYLQASVMICFSDRFLLEPIQPGHS